MSVATKTPGTAPDDGAVLSRFMSNVSRRSQRLWAAESDLELAMYVSNTPHAPRAPSAVSEGSDEPKEPARLIDFEPGDPEDPRNWSNVRRSLLAVCMILLVVNSTFASSLPSGCADSIREYFGVPQIKITLLVTCYLIGYIVGPLAWAPMSEHFGRQWIMLVSYLGYVVFTIACAVAPTMDALIVFRFLQGLCAASPISLVGGVFSDIFGDPLVRGRAIAAFSGATSIGPLMGPPVGGYVSTRLGWRWAFWVNVLFGAVSLVYLLVVQCETFRPVLMLRRARRLRAEGHNVVCALDLSNRSFRSVYPTVLMRPFKFLFREIIVAMICLYMSFIYGVLYMFFSSYSIIFGSVYHMGPGKVGLMMLPIGVGTMSSCAIMMYYDERKRVRLTRTGKTLTIEQDRLPLTALFTLLLPVALMWLAWTASASIPFVVPMLAGITFGLAFNAIFSGFFNYATDCYRIYSASVMAIMSMTRSVIGATFPLFTDAMYDRLGVHWATALLGFLAIGLGPIPFLFLKYGERLRANSAFCTSLATQDI
ncbi:major facilitator superfamily domain-containing protein [Dipodascopsis tothii]|uniref:major facilitator superfamily domain-containing protein n=1 Tax=Dipodascopsis tothii TaxID=44089 RepID=UPI0034D009CA